MKSINKVIESLSAKSENFTSMGDFNATKLDTSVENFCDI